MQKHPPEVFHEKVVLKNFAIFIGLRACNFIKRRLQHRCFLVNIAKFLRTSILKNIYKRLLLPIMPKIAEDKRLLTNNKQKNSPGGVLWKGVLQSFANFTGNLATLLKNCLRRRCFPVDSVKFLRTPTTSATTKLSNLNYLKILIQMKNEILFHNTSGKFCYPNKNKKYHTIWSPDKYFFNMFPHISLGMHIVQIQIVLNFHTDYFLKSIW